MNTEKSRKQSEVMVEELTRRSRKPLQLAKKTILAEKIEHRKLREALKHYTLHWNDFTHSGSLSMACEAVGGNPDVAVDLQAAITLMAAAFDMHDDIIDESKVKHGMPTVFGKFGKNITLLLGNAFFVEGFSLFAKSVHSLPQEEMKEILEILKTALFEVGNAHALEFNLKDTGSTDPEEYVRIFRMKAASIEADFKIGAIVGKGTKNEIEALARYGRILGTLTQLREEFIDIFETQELNQRVRSEYLPLPILYAMQDNELRERIQRLMVRRKLTNRNVEELIDVIFKPRNTEELTGMMKNLVTESIHCVSKIKREDIGELLSRLASSMLEDL